MKHPIPDRLLYPIAEAAYLLGVHRTTLYLRAHAGTLTLVRIADRTYVTAAELARYVADETEPAHIGRRAPRP